MKLEELREIAKARTPGHLTALSVSVQETQTDDSGKSLAVMVYDDIARKEDMKFIATIANHTDAILDLWEAAEVLLNWCNADGVEISGMQEVDDALKKLRGIK